MCSTLEFTLCYGWKNSLRKWDFWPHDHAHNHSNMSSQNRGMVWQYCWPLMFFFLLFTLIYLWYCSGFKYGTWWDWFLPAATSFSPVWWLSLMASQWYSWNNVWWDLSPMSQLASQQAKAWAHQELLHTSHQFSDSLSWWLGGMVKMASSPPAAYPPLHFFIAYCLVPTSQLASWGQKSEQLRSHRQSNDNIMKVSV